MHLNTLEKTKNINENDSNPHTKHKRLPVDIFVDADVQPLHS